MGPKLSPEHLLTGEKDSVIPETGRKSQFAFYPTPFRLLSVFITNLQWQN